MTKSPDTIATKATYHARRHVQFSWNLLRESLRLTPSQQLPVQLVRSLFVSAVALVFDFGLLIVFKQDLGIQYLVAATLSYSVGILVNYVLSVAWVIPDHKLASKHAEFTIFAVVNLIGLALNLIIIASLVGIFSADYRVAKAVSTVIIFFWNFILRKMILY